MEYKFVEHNKNDSVCIELGMSNIFKVMQKTVGVAVYTVPLSTPF